MAHILIVDDYAEFPETLEYCLPRFGHAGWSAADENEARLLATNHPIDLVLIDIGWPDCPGLAICESLKHDPRFCGIPLLVMTSVITAEIQERARDAGADELVAKPFGWNLFLASVDRLLAKATLSETRDRR